MLTGENRRSLRPLTGEWAGPSAAQRVCVEASAAGREWAEPSAAEKEWAEPSAAGRGESGRGGARPGGVGGVRR